MSTKCFCLVSRGGLGLSLKGLKVTQQHRNRLKLKVEQINPVKCMSCTNQFNRKTHRIKSYLIWHTDSMLVHTCVVFWLFDPGKTNPPWNHAYLQKVPIQKENKKKRKKKKTCKTHFQDFIINVECSNTCFHVLAELAHFI